MKTDTARLERARDYLVATGIHRNWDHFEMVAVRLAEFATREQAGWQDIATAPRDGTWILVWDNWNTVQLVHWDENAWYMAGFRILVTRPLLWQPLPQPPQGE